VPEDVTSVADYDVVIVGSAIYTGRWLPEARELVADGAVSVNGETDERRGRQLVPGDVVSVSGPGGTRTARVARA